MKCIDFSSEISIFQNKLPWVSGSDKELFSTIGNLHKMIASCVCLTPVFVAWKAGRFAKQKLLKDEVKYAKK